VDLRDLLNLLRRSWLGVLLATLLGGAVAGAYVATIPPVHVATTQLYVSIQSGGSVDAAELVQGSNAAQQKVRSYVDVVGSRSVLDPVVRELDLAESAAVLAERVTASSPQDTVLIDIAVEDGSEERAVAIADAIGRSLKKVVAGDLEAGPPGSSLVHLATTQPATAADATVRPRPLRDVVLGLLCGFSVAAVTVVVRSKLDTRIRTGADAERVAQLPVLGSIAFDADAGRHPLIVAHAPRDSKAECFRSLRTALRFTAVDGARPCFVITSSLPGEGKSTTAANLAVALAESGARVILVDADLRRPRMADLFGIEGAAGLTDVLIGRVELDDVLQPWGQAGLTLLPTGSVPPNPSELLGSRGMAVLFEQLATSFDVVLVDAPPLLPVTDAAILTKLAGGAVVVAESGTTRAGDLSDALRTLETIGERALGVVVTKLPVRTASAYAYGPVEDGPAAGRSIRRRRSVAPTTGARRR